MATDSPNPRAVLLIFGKRKCGKDFLTDILQERFGNQKCVVLRLSMPIKWQYAKDHNLDYDRLMDASDYKERYRADMIAWGEKLRSADPSYFCKKAVEMGQGYKYPIWVISDLRRMTDLLYFRGLFAAKVKLIMVTADDSVRISRGWKWTDGIDNAESETGLDHVHDYNHILRNNGSQSDSLNLNSLVDELVLWANLLLT